MIKNSKEFILGIILNLGLNLGIGLMSRSVYVFFYYRYEEGWGLE